MFFEYCFVDEEWFYVLFEGIKDEDLVVCVLVGVMVYMGLVREV